MLASPPAAGRETRPLQKSVILQDCYKIFDFCRKKAEPLPLLAYCVNRGKFFPWVILLLYCYK